MQNKFRELIAQEIKEKANDRNVAVLLSGGIDSTCCLLSCRDLGLNITAYTFYLEGHPSQDLKASRAITERLGIRLVEVVVPYSLDALKNDVKRIIQEYHTARKTAVQCIHPFLYVMPKIKEQYIVSGLYADDLYGTSRKGNIAGHKSKDDFDRLRRQQLSLQDYSCVYIKKCAEKYKKTLITPFNGKYLSEYLLSLTWDEMNKPKPKAIAVKAFSDFYNSGAWYRKNSNLQCNSGIREYHDLLLKTDLNKRKNESVVAIYNDIYHEVL